MRRSPNGAYVRFADVAPLLAVIEHQFARAMFAGRPPVVMCGCEDFMACEHPYPELARL